MGFKIFFFDLTGALKRVKEKQNGGKKPRKSHETKETEHPKGG